MKKTVVVTGAAGYIGSLVCGMLLQQGYTVRAVDSLLYGGDSLISYFCSPRFSFIKADVGDSAVIRKTVAGADAVIHLAAVVGFPLCRELGREETFKINCGYVRDIYDLCCELKVKRFIFSSTYSNYGIAEDEYVIEESPLHPQSDYAEAKVQAERYLLSRDRKSICKPVIFRFATVYGISPRTRFDLIINQFVLEALTEKKIVIFEGDYYRSFVHVHDVGKGILLALKAPGSVVDFEVFNLGSADGNITKTALVQLVACHCPGTVVEYKKMKFKGDMRDIKVDYSKITQKLHFSVDYSLENGIVEVKKFVEDNMISDPSACRHRNFRNIIN